MLSNSEFSTDKYGWSEMLPERQPCPVLHGEHRAKWVVIGAGFTGLASARRLAQLHPQEEIIVVDARQVGQAASGRNSGFAVAISDFPKGETTKEVDNYQRLNRINQAGLEMLREQVDNHSIDCQWDDGGFYRTAAGDEALREYDNLIFHLEMLNIDHRVLDTNALARELGTSHYKAGIHLDNGVLLNPASLVRGLADNLPKNVKLIEQNAVLEIDRGTPITLRLADATIKTDKLVLAVNHEAGKLGYLGNRLIGSTLAASITRVLNGDEMESLGVKKQWGILSLHGGGATIRLTADRRIQIRNTAEYFGGRLMSDAKIRTRQKIHRKSFELRFPQLAHVPFEYSWSCVEGISANLTHFFGKQADNIYLAGGFNGSGVTRGTAFGSALAEFANGHSSNLISDCLSNAPAPWLPPRPLLDIGAYFKVRSRFRGVGQDR